MLVIHLVVGNPVANQRRVHSLVVSSTYNGTTQIEHDRSLGEVDASEDSPSRPIRARTFHLFVDWHKATYC